MRKSPLSVWNMSQAVHPTDSPMSGPASPAVEIPNTVGSCSPAVASPEAAPLDGPRLSVTWQLPDQPDEAAPDAANRSQEPESEGADRPRAATQVQGKGGDRHVSINSTASDASAPDIKQTQSTLSANQRGTKHSVKTRPSVGRTSVSKPTGGGRTSKGGFTPTASLGNSTKDRFERTRNQMSEALHVEEEFFDKSKVVPVDEYIRKLKDCTDSKAYFAVSMTALAIALFGGALFLLIDIPDDPGTVLLDTLMSLVTVFFLLEILILTLAGNGYPLSFFFWMDILGTISMIFEISFLLGTAGKMRVDDSEVNPVLLRSARAAKVGARAARLTKVFKCFSFQKRKSFMLKNVNGEDIAVNQVPEYDAQILKRRLNNSLSSKVSMLTVGLVIATPMFNIGRYPEEDYSMKGWARTLELDYSRAWSILDGNSSLVSTTFFSATVSSMVSFYDDIAYKPFKVEGWNSKVVVAGRNAVIKGEMLVHGDTPARKQNIVFQPIKKCLVDRGGCTGEQKAGVYLDFQMANRYEAVLDISVIIFIVSCMIFEAWDLSRSVDVLVVKPVEKMLGTVQMMANILTAVRPHGSGDKDYESEDEAGGDPFANTEGLSEAQMLEFVFARFSNLVGKFMKQSQAEEMEIADQAMDDESKGVLLELMGLGDDHTVFLSSQIGESTQNLDDWGKGKVVAVLPVDEEVLDSWDLDVWSMVVEDKNKCVRYYFFDQQESPGRIWTEVPVFFKFQELVRLQYNDTNAYHNYSHACDVVASVVRVFRRLRCREWLSDIDMYALMVSALCHDVAHPGFTTPFLVETRHELAVRYNDASPLEAMHCSKLFDICNQDGANVFERFEKDAYKQARKVCINSILHTDNAHHFEMVKAVKDAYEVSSDICDVQETGVDSWFSEAYLSEVLYKFTTLWQQMILHMCDVSNPLKPWKLSRILATCVQDEFFAQGDEEKRLGIPVGMLNDRDKVNRSGAEHGFINFLVAPLVLGVVGSFPHLHHLASQMVTNMKEWRDLWAADTKPSAEDLAKRDADIKKIHDQVVNYGDRKPISTLRNQKTAASMASSKQ